MSVRENCDKVLLLQAEFDGELDAAQSVTLNAHRLGCAYCQDAWERLQASRQMVRTEASYHPASTAFKDRLQQQLVTAGLSLPAHHRPAAPARRGLLDWWRGLLGFGMGVAVAASAMIFFLQPPAAGDLADLVLASHVRSLQAGHLVDIASNNQHNVRPWFDGKLDFAPPVKNLTDQGFPLEGGRLDYLQDRGVAALVYQAGLHRINLLVWPSPGGVDEGPQTIDKGGYNVIHWREKEMNLWVVSDLNPAELQKFVTVWRAHD